MSVENFFTPRSLAKSDSEARLTFLTVKFIWISTLFAAGYFGFSFITGLLLPRYLMILVSLLFLIELVALKYTLVSRRMVANIFVIICWSIIVLLTLGSGGIHSYVLPWVALLPIIALVLLEERGAWLWSMIGLLTVFYFLSFETNPLRKEWLITNNNLWISSLHVGLLFIILILTAIFERQQKRLIKKIEDQNHSLLASQEEIMQQSYTVENQYKLLKDAQHLIDQQHLALQSKNAELEHEIEKRTKDLLEYTQQLEQFAFISSHNLRSPIARILGLGNLLDITNNPVDVKLIQEKLVLSARELDGAVRDLALLLEVKKGNTASFSTVDVHHELQSVIRNLERDIQETGCRIDIDVKMIGSIYTIRPYFISIIINLLNNAIKYRDPQRPLSIQLFGKMENELAFFSVKDNGIGIDLSKHSNKLFGLYSRFHTHVDGKGIGLYLVKTQVEMMGGKIEVNSEVNQGTEFRFWIKA
ncbi:MAG TPA: hypothetical protein DGG95_02100 [Cytophagales bacterium]|jgi:signal transduction histidine kinase|nr:hypothetical protein [Cytophagales bacterium]